MANLFKVNSTMELSLFLFLHLSTLFLSCKKTMLPQSTATTLAIHNTLSATGDLAMTVATLRKQNVSDSIVYQTTDLGGGTWKYDPLDKTSPDNTGTVLVAAGNKRLKRIFQGAINVRWFGATGDGISDQTAFLNLALAASHTQKKDLYIPGGTYLCNQLDPNHHILFFDAANTNNQTIYGDGPSSRITTSVATNSVLLYVRAYSSCTNLTLKSLFLESTHSLTNQYTEGLFLQGNWAQYLAETLVTECVFEGFSTAIGCQGLNGISISTNTFGAPKGHDNAENNTKPAVFIWLYDNTNGYCSNISIMNNVASGYTGTAAITALTTKRPMDGFIYGTGYGYVISGNVTSNFSEEHIAIAPPASFPHLLKPILIAGNVLDGSIPKGAMNPDGSPHTSNYGIRCDAGNTVIDKNTLNNFTQGIMIRTTNYPQLSEGLFMITSNILNAAGYQDGLQVHNAISVQGSLANRLHNISIEHNVINVPNSSTLNGFNGILVYDTDTAFVSNNTITVGTLLAPKNINSYGRNFGRVKMITDKNNTVKGILPHNVIAASDQVSF